MATGKSIAGRFISFEKRQQGVQRVFCGLVSEGYRLPFTEPVHMYRNIMARGPDNSSPGEDKSTV